MCIRDRHMQKNQDKIKSHFNDSIKTMQKLASRILNFTKLITKLAILFHLGIKSNLIKLGNNYGPIYICTQNITTICKLVSVFSNAALANQYHTRDSNHPDPNGIGSVYTNPIIESNSPDPGVLALPDGSGYVLVSTSNYAESGNGIY